MNESTADTKPVEAPTRQRPLILYLVFLSLLAMVAIYYQVGNQAGFDQRYIAVLGHQEVVSQALAKNAVEAVSGRVEAFAQLKRSRDDFEESLELLRKGDPEAGLPALPDTLDPSDASLVDQKLRKIEELWAKAAESADAILQVMQPITTLHDSVDQYDQLAADTLVAVDEVVNMMVESGASQEQIYVATRELMLMERISNNMRRTLAGGQDAVTAGDRFGRDADLFGQVLEALLNGDDRLGIEAVGDQDVREVLEAIHGDYAQSGDLIDQVLENSVELFQVQDASSDLSGLADVLRAANVELAAVYRDGVANRWVSATLGNIFAGIGLVLLILAGLRMTRAEKERGAEARLRAEEAQRREVEARAREEETKEANRRNQESILHLLGEISDLADGDLTVNATVTEDFTGAIADAFNYAVEALRELVANINHTSGDVAKAAQDTRNQAIELSKASERQAGQIEQASVTISKVAEVTERMSEAAVSSSEVAERSLSIAAEGGSAVRDTIAGMNSIRETIQETSKRIKRLGESSQEIGDIVGLIDDIADQTNILALNAAIQASMAGEAGRGFAVVADEVQRLAERSGQATKQIEELVKTIQSDTNDAVLSMEKSTADVVEGAKLAQGAGESLEEIETVSAQLAEQIQGISTDSRQQAEQAMAISQGMQEIRDITTQTTEGTQGTATLVGNLAELASDLKTSVAGFTLPEDTAAVESVATDEQDVSDSAMVG